MSLTETESMNCPHAREGTAEPRSQTCEECAAGVNLRVCTECGHVGCCESQQGHNTAHYRESGHAVIKSMPIDERSFTWCYECGRYL